MFNIGGIQKTTLVDFPGKIAAIVFTQGCNFNCGYCHNPELIKFSSAHNESGTKGEEFLDFLATRKGKLDGVVITGGEPTIQNGLYDFILKIKQIGFLVKLDTNGTNPNIIKKLLDANLLDYIAMDIKAPLEKYFEITKTRMDIKKIQKSINLIINSDIDYEFRTTVIKSQLSSTDFSNIGQLIKGAKKYFLQKFIPSKVNDENFLSESTYTNEEFEKICYMLRNYIDVVNFR